jgi:hypothetical protein
MIKIGYWNDDIKPIVSPNIYKDIFVNKCKLLKKCIDDFNTYDIYLYRLQKDLANRTNPNIYFDAYCGYSYCRICNKLDNGDKDIILISEGKSICIPEGYLHYIFEHNINISKEFENYIIEFDFESVISAINEMKLYYETQGNFIREMFIQKNIYSIQCGDQGIKYSN